MLMNFFVKIVNSTAQSYLKEQQEIELAKQSSTKAHSKWACTAQWSNSCTLLQVMEFSAKATIDVTQNSLH